VTTWDIKVVLCIYLVLFVLSACANSSYNDFMIDCEFTCIKLEYNHTYFAASDYQRTQCKQVCMDRYVGVSEDLHD